jgi:hypothetical protein
MHCVSQHSARKFSASVYRFCSHWPQYGHPQSCKFGKQSSQLASKYCCGSDNQNRKGNSSIRSSIPVRRRCGLLRNIAQFDRSYFQEGDLIIAKNISGVKFGRKWTCKIMKESRFLERSMRTSFLKTEPFSIEHFSINRETTELINFNHTTL